MNLTGYASVTGVGYDMGFYTETIQRGAFKKTLSENPDVQLLINHEGLPLARTKSGTLKLSEDNTGLLVDADLDPEDPDVQSLSRKMRRGDIDQMSFSFRAVRQSWNEDYSKRSIAECNIDRGDVSVVNQGASSTTSASIRGFGARSKSTVAQRRQWAAELGNHVLVVERRAFSRASRLHIMRADVGSAGDESCARCGGDGTIDLGAGPISCPQCKGSGGPEGNASSSSVADDARARLHAYELQSARMRLQAAALRYGYRYRPPRVHSRSPVVEARMRLEELRYPPRPNR